MTETTEKKIIRSWQDRDGNVNSTPDILAWINDLNEKTCVRIEECSLDDCVSWHYDRESGRIVSSSGKFFSVAGMRWYVDGEVVSEQPIMIQPEIGYLGILCAEIGGELNFLMQAKIEPGNINCVQLSPTIQATRSNFMRVHGGRTPEYLDIFSGREGCRVIYDRVQSEQGSRFLRKRNRNIILMMDGDAASALGTGPNFRWMTLGQIKELMKYDNLVNMDSRTVLSGLPLGGAPDDCVSEIHGLLNDYRMYHDVMTEEVPLHELADWTLGPDGVDCAKPADFNVRCYNIEIEGREVRKWDQPLFRAAGMAVFGLLSRKRGSRREYLIRLRPEIGCFDMAEMGPSVQWEPTHDASSDNGVDRLFREKLAAGSGIITDVILSEEGGRFYHEQNRNLIIEIGEEELPAAPEGCVWADLESMSRIIRAGEGFNIQLRNLVSLIDIQA